MNDIFIGCSEECDYEDIRGFSFVPEYEFLTQTNNFYSLANDDLMGVGVQVLIKKNCAFGRFITASIMKKVDPKSLRKKVEDGIIREINEDDLHEFIKDVREYAFHEGQKLIQDKLRDAMNVRECLP